MGTYSKIHRYSKASSFLPCQPGQKWDVRPCHPHDWIIKKRPYHALSFIQDITDKQDKKCTLHHCIFAKGHLAFITSFRPVAFSTRFWIVIAQGLMTVDVLERCYPTCHICRHRLNYSFSQISAETNSIITKGRLPVSGSSERQLS